MRSLSRFLLPAVMLGICTAASAAEAPPQITIQADQPGVKISPSLYGLMTEEINYSYQGGLYGELIQNRDFKLDDGPSTQHWTLLENSGVAAMMALDPDLPVNPVSLPFSLRLDVAVADDRHPASVANEGYWGIPVRPETAYRVSFYARCRPGFEGPVTVSIQSSDGATTYAEAKIPQIGNNWHAYQTVLTTGKLVATKDARFVLSVSKPGLIWFSQVSLFPPTYHNRPNGTRPDLMQKMAAMHPAFLRFPGGNYLEGNTLQDHFDWKKTIDPVSTRPGHASPWNYHSTDGFGLLEFLEWCEDLHMQPLVAIFAGYTLNHEYLSEDQLTPYVQDALDEIEYITGDSRTTWGARRAADGHPAPFTLQYVEIGNEDMFDGSHSYSVRFAAFADAIKAKYPYLKMIATTPVDNRTPDLLDEHFYNPWQKMVQDVHHYDHYSRTGPKIFVGEWASQDVPDPWVDPGGKGPTPSMKSALGDASWMIGLERNSDVVLLQCYAPLLVNVNPGGRQWAVNLIGYDALNSFGSPSYYAECMFANNRGDVVLPVTLSAGTGPSAEPAPHGGIGVGTWSTQAEYKDIVVTQGGRAVYRSDFQSGIGSWTLGRGDWQSAEGALRQTGSGTDAHATLGNAQWTDYTLSLKARKIDGDEGFLIRFHALDGDNYVHWNVGGWGNHQHGLEKAVDGVKTDLGARVAGSIDAGRWYDLRVELSGRDIRCYLDGQLVNQAQDSVANAAEPMIVTASRDLASRDVILKAVNPTPHPQRFGLALAGGDHLTGASGQVMTGDLDAVNTLAAPEKVAPQPVTLATSGSGFTYEFPANSITVLRLKVN